MGQWSLKWANEADMSEWVLNGSTMLEMGA